MVSFAAPPVVACAARNGVARNGTPPSRVTRRLFARLAASAAFVPSLLHARVWSPDELCTQCSGSGEQTCGLCEGVGLLDLGGDLSMAASAAECPNCGGDGTVRCPKCIGLGLADTNGILRDGASPSAS